MPEFTKTVTNPNWELLIEEIQATYPNMVYQTYPRAIGDPQEIRVVDDSLDEATLDGIIAAHNPSVLTLDQQVESAQSGLLDKVDLAKNFASSIKALFNATLDQTENQTTQPTRFDNLKAVIDAQPIAFKNRFNTDLLQEGDIDILDVLLFTNGQKADYCRYARLWSTQLGLLLSWHS